MTISKCSNQTCSLLYAHSGPCDTRLFESEKALRIMSRTATKAAGRAEHATALLARVWANDELVCIDHNCGDCLGEEVDSFLVGVNKDTEVSETDTSCRLHTKRAEVMEEALGRIVDWDYRGQTSEDIARNALILTEVRDGS